MMVRRFFKDPASIYSTYYHNYIENSDLEESQNKNKHFAKNYGLDSDDEDDDGKFGKGYHKEESSDGNEEADEQEDEDNLNGKFT